MTEMPESKPITRTHINIARYAVSQLRERDETYANLRSPTQLALDNVVGKLSACGDSAKLFAVEKEQINHVNQSFLELGHGVIGKTMAMDMIDTYMNSMCGQLGLERPARGMGGKA